MEAIHLLAMPEETELPTGYPTQAPSYPYTEHVPRKLVDLLTLPWVPLLNGASISCELRGAQDQDGHTVSIRQSSNGSAR